MKGEKMYYICEGKLYTDWTMTPIFSKNKKRLEVVYKARQCGSYKKDTYNCFVDEVNDHGFKIKECYVEMIDTDKIVIL